MGAARCWGRTRSRSRPPRSHQLFVRLQRASGLFLHRISHGFAISSPDLDLCSAQKSFQLVLIVCALKCAWSLRIARLCKCRFGRKAVISSHRVRLEKQGWCQRGEGGGRTEVERKWNQEPQFRGCQSYTTALSTAELEGIAAESYTLERNSRH